ncbi:20S proteasome subunit alpha 2, partial [Phenoliferia sp. Uapishka_3]
MAQPGSGGAYSFSLTTFSPSGKLVQIEHALAAVASGTTSLGIKATNGIVVATSKKTPSPLVDDTVLEKVALICPNIGLVYSGMGPDFRVLVAKARKSAQAYWKIYGEYPSTRVLVGEIATVMQEATQSGGVRPFGVSLLVAGWDCAKGHTLYQVDPSGSYWAWKASAIGKNQVNAKTFLEKRYNDELSLEDAIHTALLTLKEGFEGVMTEKTIEIGIISTAGFSAEALTLGGHGTGGAGTPGFRKLTEAEVAESRKYCTVDCQKLDWKLHKSVCKAPGPDKPKPKLASSKSSIPKGGKTRKGPAPFFHDEKTAEAFDPAITSLMVNKKTEEYINSIQKEICAHLVTHSDYFERTNDEGELIHLWLEMEFDPDLDTSVGKNDTRHQFIMTGALLLDHKGWMQRMGSFPMYRGEANREKLLAIKRPWHKKAWELRSTDLVFGIGMYFVYAGTHSQGLVDWATIGKNRSMVPTPLVSKHDKKDVWKFALRDGLRGDAPNITALNGQQYILTAKEDNIAGSMLDQAIKERHEPEVLEKMAARTKEVAAAKAAGKPGNAANTPGHLGCPVEVPVPKFRRVGPPPFYYESKGREDADPAITNSVFNFKVNAYLKLVREELTAHFITYADDFARKAGDGKLVNISLDLDFDPKLDKSEGKDDLRQQFVLTRAAQLSDSRWVEHMSSAFYDYNGQANRPKLLALKDEHQRKAWACRSTDIVIALTFRCRYSSIMSEGAMDWPVVPKNRSMMPNISNPNPSEEDKDDAWKFALRESLEGEAPRIQHFDNKNPGKGGGDPYIVTAHEEEMVGKMIGDVLSEKTRSDSLGHKVEGFIKAMKAAVDANQPFPDLPFDPIETYVVVTKTYNKARLQVKKQRALKSPGYLGGPPALPAPPQLIPDDLD